MARKASKVTIYDIASAAGVSRGTVSRAFNGNTDINSETRQRIFDTAKRLHYVPNMNARGLAKGTTECIGVIMPDVLNPYISELVGVIEKSARAVGFSTHIALTHNDAELQQKLLLRMASGQVDGIIITPCESDESVRQINMINAKIPIVSLKFREKLECDTVMGADSDGIRMIMEHLHSAGAKKVAFLTISGQDWTHLERHEAYLSTAKKLGLDYTKTESIDYSEGWEEMEKDVIRIVASLFKRKDNAPDAILAYDDILALVVINALRHSGIKVPDDVLVAGFDNIRLASVANMTLTSASVESSDIARFAIDILTQRLNSSSSSKVRHVRISPRLYVRDSTSRETLKGKGK